MNILGLICIIIAFLLAIIGGHFLFQPLVWLIAAIAFNTVGGIVIPFVRRNQNG